jgi:hypothetical protein
MPPHLIGVAHPNSHPRRQRTLLAIIRVIPSLKTMAEDRRKTERLLMNDEPSGMFLTGITRAAPPLGQRRVLSNFRITGSVPHLEMPGIFISRVQTNPMVLQKPDSSTMNQSTAL